MKREPFTVNISPRGEPERSGYDDAWLGDADERSWSDSYPETTNERSKGRQSDSAPHADPFSNQEDPFSGPAVDPFAGHNETHVPRSAIPGSPETELGPCVREMLRVPSFLHCSRSSASEYLRSSEAGLEC